MLSKNLVQIYSLVICLISSLILMIILALSFISLSNLALSEYKYKSELYKYSTNENYIEYRKNSGKDNSNISSEVLQSMRLKDKNEFLQSQKDRAISELINYVSWFIVSIIFFYIHWKLYKNALIEKG